MVGSIGQPSVIGAPLEITRNTLSRGVAFQLPIFPPLLLRESQTVLHTGMCSIPNFVIKCRSGQVQHWRSWSVPFRQQNVLIWSSLPPLKRIVCTEFAKCDCSWFQAQTKVLRMKTVGFTCLFPGFTNSHQDWWLHLKARIHSPYSLQSYIDKQHSHEVNHLLCHTFCVQYIPFIQPSRTPYTTSQLTS